MVKSVNRNDSASTTYSGRKKYRKGKSALSLKQKIAVQAIAKKAVEAKPELKVYDDQGNNQTLVNAGLTAVDLSLVSQGYADESRVGNRITPKYLSMRFRIVGNTSASAVDNAYRVIIVQWRPNSADVYPTNALVFEDSTQVQSYYARTRKGQFKVLYDLHGLASSVTSADEYMNHFEVNIPGKVMRQIDFNDANTTGENHIFLLAFSNEVTNACRMIWTSRMGFTDC